jgi:hypothetical protein
MSRVDSRNTLKKARPASSVSTSGWVSSLNSSHSNAQPTSRTMKFATESTSESNRSIIQPYTSCNSTATQTASTSYRHASPQKAVKQHPSSKDFHSTATLRSGHSSFERPQEDLGDWRYWATRSLRAEIMLAEQTIQKIVQHGHDEDLSERLNELCATAREVKIRTRKLQLKRYQRIIWFLALCLAFFVGFVFYHAIYSHSHPKSGAWHFTIPILSPFTSVVEHESSVIGSKTIAFGGSIMAMLAYFMFRYWLSHRQKIS